MTSVCEREFIDSSRFRFALFTSRWAATILLCIGLILRLARYLQARSLWDDEASLAYNIVSLPFADLFKSLHFDQSAPFGFLLLSRWMVDVWGPHELALRLAPLLAGLLSLPLFWFVARRLLPARAALAALLMFVVSETLIYYTSEVKQYSFDVMVTLAVLAAFTSVDWAKPRIGRVTLLTLVCCAGMWFSHPAIFIVAALCLCTAAHAWFNSRPLAAPLCIGILCLVHFVLCYSVSMSGVAGSDFMHKFWLNWGGFMPVPPTNPQDLQWYIKTITEYFTDPAGLRPAGLFGVFVAGIGVVYFWHNDRERMGWIILPILFVLAASALQRYPFAVSPRDYPPYPGRLILFTVPLVFLLVATGLERVARIVHPKATIIASIFLALLTATPVLLAAKRLVSPPGHMSLREQIAFVRGSMSKGDAIYLHWSTQPSFNYYRLVSDLPGDSLHLGIHSRDDWEGYEEDLLKLAGVERVWIVFTHHPDFNIVNEMRTFHFLLGKQRSKLDTQTFIGGEVSLWTRKESAPVTSK